MLDGQLPEYKDGKVLLVCLSRPATSTGQETLENIVRKALSRKKNVDTDPSIVLCPDNTKQKLRELQHKDGSNAELFQVASAAFAKGWHHIAIADNLTYRQVQGDLRYTEREGPSLIVLQMSNKQGQATEELIQADPEIRAKRFNIQDAIRILGSGKHVSITPFEKQDVRGKQKRMFDEYGMFLFNPEMPLFQHGSEASDSRQEYERSKREALTSKPSLPAEVVDLIDDMVDEERPLEDLTAAPSSLRRKMRHLEVHALIPLVDVDAVQAALNERIKNIDEDMTAVIYPWKAQLPATRREFWRLWKRMLVENTFPFWFGACFLQSATAIDDDTLTMALWHCSNPTVVCNINLEHVVPLWKKYFNADRMVRGEHDLPPQAVKSVELLYNPDARFFNDPPEWKDLDGGNRPPVFFLTNRPNQETAERIRNLMINDLDGYGTDVGDNPYNFIEWRGEEDGDERDMLRIAIECSKYQGGRQGPGYFIFADQQTLNDQTVIMCDYTGYDFYDEPDGKEEDYYEGIRYVRTPAREAWIQWINLDIANLGWEDFYHNEGDTAERFLAREFASEEERQRAASEKKRSWLRFSNRDEQD